MRGDSSPRVCNARFSSVLSRLCTPNNSHVHCAIFCTCSRAGACTVACAMLRIRALNREVVLAGQHRVLRDPDERGSAIHQLGQGQGRCSHRVHALGGGRLVRQQPPGMHTFGAVCALPVPKSREFRTFKGREFRTLFKSRELRTLFCLDVFCLPDSITVQTDQRGFRRKAWQYFRAVMRKEPGNY